MDVRFRLRYTPSQKRVVDKSSVKSVKLHKPKQMHIVDLNGNVVNIDFLEKPEQDLVRQYIVGTDVVLELGARYGSVSCAINSKLDNKQNQLVVEPDDRVWSALEINKTNNNCGFHIVKGFISNKKLDLTNLDDYYGGYGATYIETNDTKIPSYPLCDITNKYNLNFNVLVADCEGYLEEFFNENPNFYDNLRLIIFEADYPDKCNYANITTQLKKRNFKPLLEGHQNVWKL
jgi:FkbM family methyltransferase